MKEQLINFKTAKLAKEKGFKWKARSCYDTKGELSGFSGHSLMMGYNTNSKINLICNDTEEFEYPKSLCTASTQSLLQKWLREEHGVYVAVSASPISGIVDYYYLIRYGKNIGKLKSGEDPLTHKTWEEALEKGLLEALKLI